MPALDNFNAAPMGTNGDKVKDLEEILCFKLQVFFEKIYSQK